MKAIWNNQVIAASYDIVVVEENPYFPLSSVNKQFLIESNTETICPWKGTASYFSIKIGDNINEDAAWYYKNPNEAAKEIENRIAFWKGVKVERA